MPHTPGNLHVGIGADGSDIAHPDPFWREIGENIEFEVETPCYVVFKTNRDLDDAGYDHPTLHPRKPKTRRNCTISYNVIPYNDASRRYSPRENTHSIKIGSGLEARRKKANPKAKAKGKKATPKKRTKKTTKPRKRK